MGGWAARASGARPRCPRPTMISQWRHWRRVSGGALGAQAGGGAATDAGRARRARRACLGLPVSKLERWRLRALAGIEAGLRERDDDPKELELTEAPRRIGELSMENELLRARLEKRRAFAPQEVGCRRRRINR